MSTPTTEQPTKVSFRALGAENMVAQAIEGFMPGSLRLYDRESGATIHIDGRPRVCEHRDFISLQFVGETIRTAEVTIERPRRRFGARGPLEMSRVTWSTGGQSDLASAKATAELLLFAVEVAGILDSWAERGELPRLRADEATGEPLAASASLHAMTGPDFVSGDEVDVSIYAPGGEIGRFVGTVRGTILNVGAEVDIILADASAVAEILADADVDVDGLREFIRPYPGARGSAVEVIHVLRNVQRDQVTPVV
jgi:hypothetical protein